MASPSKIGATGSVESNSAVSLTVSSYALSGAGSNRILLVFVQTFATPTGMTATWNTSEVATNLIANSANQLSVQNVFYLINPTATTANLVVAWTGSLDQCTVTCIVLQDAKQTSPSDSTPSVSGGGTGATSSTDSVTTGTDNSAIFNYTVIASTGSLPVAQGSGTLVVNYTRTGTSKQLNEVVLLATTTAGANNVGLDWTGSSSYDKCSFSIKYEAPAVDTGTTKRGLALVGVGQ